MHNPKMATRVRWPIFLLALLLAIVIPLAVIWIRSLPNRPGEPQPGPGPVNEKPAVVRTPVFMEVVAQYPGASPEEIERQVTIPLEVNLFGVPGLKISRSKSQFGMSCLSLEFDEGTKLDQARQEVVNRLNTLQNLPPGVIPLTSPSALDNEVVRYVLNSPKDEQGRPIYTLSDLRGCQDWILEREFRRLPGVIDVSSVGGTVKRYEVHLDLNRLQRFGITIKQVQGALSAGNANVGGDFHIQGPGALNVRSVGLFGGGVDPVQKVLALKNPLQATELLRKEEARRVGEIRQVVVANVMGNPVLLEDLIEGGRLIPGEMPGRKGVVVAHHPRQGRVGLAGPGPSDGNDEVEGIVLRRPGEDPSQVLERVTARIKELNETPNKLLPGVSIEIIHKSQPADSTLWIHGRFPAASSREVIADKVRNVRNILSKYPEVQFVLSQIGGEGGTDLFGSNRVEYLVAFKPGPSRIASRIVETIRSELKRAVAGVDWTVSSHQRDPFLSAFVASPDEQMVKIIGPDLAQLDKLAHRVQSELAGIDGIEDVTVCEIMGRPTLEFRVDLEKCKKWGIPIADVTNLIQLSVAARSVTTMVEGDRQFDITLRLLPTGQSTLDLPLDISNNGLDPPEKPIANPPRLRLRDLVSPIGPDGAPDSKGEFERIGASVIYREQGKRCIAITFRITAGDRAAILKAVRQKTDHLIAAPYEVE
jgi:Cu/Ag efflux pump CusA